MPGEGARAGAEDSARANRLAVERERAEAACNAAQNAANDGNRAGASRLVGFAASSSVERVDAAFKEQTVGLMTREDFVKRQERIEAEMERERREKEAEKTLREDKLKKKLKRKRAAKTAHKLSFDDDLEGIDVDGACSNAVSTRRATIEREIDEDDANAGGMDEAETSDMARPIDDAKRKGFGLGKDPTVNTEFLPDRAREEEEERERKEIEAEFLARSRRERAESVRITYSYYDGSRRAGGKITCVKGDTVEAFLTKVRHELLKDGERTVQRDMRHCDVSGMMYVKEDLILPHDLTFYDLIVTKARGKSGPLFRFDVKDDVRLRGGANVEVENSHPGKVILRSWYDKNKSMFPANRWEVYDRGKTYAEDGYRIK